MGTRKNKMWTAFWTIGLCLLAVLFSVGELKEAWAKDLNDVEVDMEEAISQSDAAREEAKAAKKRREKENAERDKAAKEAEDAAAQARSKARDAASQIAELERQTDKAKAEKKTYLNNKKQSEAEIAKLDKSIQAKQKKFEQISKERDVSFDEKKRTEEKLAKLLEDVRQTDEKTSLLRDEKSKIEQELLGVKDRVKTSEENLVKARSDFEKATAKNKETIAKYQNEIGRNRKFITDNEGEMRRLKREEERIAEEAAIAEVEANQSKKRAKDSEEKLKKFKQEHDSRVDDLKQRKKNAQNASQRAEDQNASARIAMAQARETASVTDVQSPRTTGENPVEVTLVKKEVGVRETQKSCSLMADPSASSKVVRSLNSNMRLYTSVYNDDWIIVHKNKTSPGVGFVKKDCF